VRDAEVRAVELDGLHLVPPRRVREAILVVEVVAACDAGRSGLGTCRVGFGAPRVVAVPVAHPLPGVADHVMETECVRGLCAHGALAAIRVATMPRDRGEHAVARSLRPRAACVLPLGLGREPEPRLAAELGRLGPTGRNGQAGARIRSGRGPGFRGGGGEDDCAVGPRLRDLARK